ncbi:MAG: helix-turn-helix domain-containing protein [Planctomycetota bacterium]|jgi:AraC-like DNA-binding protein
MLDFKITYCRVFHKPEINKYKTPCHYLNLYISGMKYWNSGNLSLKEMDPYLDIIIKGTEVEFEATSERENWIITFDTENIRPCPDYNFIEIYTGQNWIKLPRLTSLDKDNLAALKVKYINIMNALNSPDPAGIFYARLETADIFKFICEKNIRKNKNSPAARFKNYIDEDKSFKYSLSELSDKCGYSCDHMRIIFEKEFDIAPHDYRTKYRLTLVNDLIAGSEKSLKEIASECGFKSVSHLSALYKKHTGIKHTGITPGEGIRKYRYHL